MITNENFIDWESEVLGYGYGDGENHIIPAIKTFFELIAGTKNSNSYDYRVIERELGGATTWLLINLLCRCDMIDYGSSPRFGWLDEKGILLKEYILSKTSEELYSILMSVDECYEYGDNKLNPLLK